MLEFILVLAPVPFYLLLFLLIVLPYRDTLRSKLHNE